ncbi:UDP-N-acetylmuramate:L-alanyl-gamma-D-glutamyl- meso-diaminopimelate ligase [Pseudomonas syringae pv. helianthi]|uniref:UDP-N-acetylmuramate--L-alanyl-gamma-D-glutamyl-meso-2,6-diaminoheptandioate ligase n=3 Tax=Pseudomonas syringae group TaxID=136849 RepID=A0A0N8RMT1_9PSED|nr:UDP-N-acetylmuramate:L-alanyl-gamma-D-glutamyl- meso-diaminopimelate ligase [Pseudomonas caricapapayae]KPX43655.1 UDP-N-acetylmuramate:L-alanyl-gamma-D-glutamyl- meso-diaminopimelate ligase [Pseudomonas syringae pv. helianthi]KPY81581.1 UDP-N-acetylmuramate:L-alanyl-gamma-D-glutamyl- meso-diaminopimelate ligase [Pseudomonas syringae pv. tagetis]RMR08368.1 UDP-N-acetylmuramate:L-alanyl-gamma-D-glutamyl- meso-diaminopimelate ligase [Pseudomonas syringae pv. helianthi]RMV69214.1 UDP-N-acetylmur
MVMHIHILGICGTFMGSLAVLAKELGHRVTGSDANVYPPMSTQLQAQGIELTQGYDSAQLDPAPDLVVVGNALSRGNPAVEYVLNKGLPYVSGPQWLADHVLQGRWVLAVAGTHGKTTTSSMLAWVLEHAGMSPGFLIGGIPQNFAVSARLGDTPFFVVEADEYDSAFFDKRSKFVHYRPRTAILNNLEFDHADIFPDLPAIERQFHHLVRTIPSEGLVIHPTTEPALSRVIEMGCWTPVQTTGQNGQWQARLSSEDGSRFEVLFEGQLQGTVDWDMTGQHNVANALATLAAARHVGVLPSLGVQALSAFKSVKRRMEKVAEVRGITIYDDFAHHPTAIATTLDGLRKKVGDAPIIAVIEPRSNSMKLGAHRDGLPDSVNQADQVVWYAPPSLGWDLSATVAGGKVPAVVCDSLEAIIARVHSQAQPGTHIVIMSNGGFGGLHGKLAEALR